MIKKILTPMYLIPLYTFCVLLLIVVLTAPLLVGISIVHIIHTCFWSVAGHYWIFTVYWLLIVWLEMEWIVRVPEKLQIHFDIRLRRYEKK